jgi:hypothetical protein
MSPAAFTDARTERPAIDATMRGPDTLPGSGMVIEPDWHTSPIERGSLTPSDLMAFDRLGIPPELLAHAHIRRVTNHEAREYGITGSATSDMSGVVFPYFDPTTGQRVTARVRRDRPEIENGKPKNKYISAYGDRKHLYFPPGVKSKLEDAATPIVLVEAEKSALALTAWAERIGRRLLAVGLGGCWGFKGRIGKAPTPNGGRVDELGTVPDLHYVDGRKVYVLLDANVNSNPKVRKAQSALVAELKKRNCEVLRCQLPAADGVNGPDDYVAVCGDEAMAKVFTDARAAIARCETGRRFKPERYPKFRGYRKPRTAARRCWRPAFRHQDSAFSTVTTVRMPPTVKSCLPGSCWPARSGKKPCTEKNAKSRLDLAFRSRSGSIKSWNALRSSKSNRRLCSPVMGAIPLHSLGPESLFHHEESGLSYRLIRSVPRYEANDR